MTDERAALRPDRATLAVGGALATVTIVSWLLVIRDASTMEMVMPSSTLNVGDGTRYVVQWGVMMAAMMLPSAWPMLMLYQQVSGRLRASGDRAVPTWFFSSVYIVAWTITGVPLYLVNVAIHARLMRFPHLAEFAPYIVAGTLATAGIYQFTAVKRACLRHCEAPLTFLMHRWRSGYMATTRLALWHAAYCVGCCWALMVVLVVAGAMSLPWVLAIAVVVFVEKIVPGSETTVRAIGVVLVTAAIAVMGFPVLAESMR